VRNIRPILCLTLAFGLMAGCQANPQAPAHISGTVTYKGSYASPLGPNGAYEVRDVPKGALVVTVETESVNPKKKQQDYGGKGAKGYAERMAGEGKAAADKAPPQSYLRIPGQYANAKTSTLSITAESGTQVHNFELTD